MPVTGLSITTVEVALVSYTLLVLFRNTLEGLRAAPPDVREAARDGAVLATGVHARRAAVGDARDPRRAADRDRAHDLLATVGGFIVPEGLGAPIFSGLREFFQTKFVVAGALAVGLALIADVLIVLLGRALTPWARAGGLRSRRPSSGRVRRRRPLRRRQPGLILEKTLEHLELSAIAIGISPLIGLPLGVVLGHLHRGSLVAINLGNIGRALPSLAVIAFGLAIFGIGTWNVVFALVVLAVPPIVTNASLPWTGSTATRSKPARDGDVAAPGGRPRRAPAGCAARWDPHRVAVRGCDGNVRRDRRRGRPGDIIVNQASYRLAGVIGAALCVSALAFAVDMLLAAVQRAATPPGLRGRMPSLEPDTSTRPAAV